MHEGAGGFVHRLHCRVRHSASTSCIRPLSSRGSCFFFGTSCHELDVIVKVLTVLTGPMRGRFAPSPTGPLHLGNLRTALVSWLQARAEGGRWLVRMEDLDRVTSSLEHEQRSAAVAGSTGPRVRRPVVRQSERFHHYLDAIDHLRAQGLVYECFCTRREIREAAHAPHGDLPDGAYPGTCRDLTDAASQPTAGNGRPPALRLRTDGERFSVDDLIAGVLEGGVDDVVLQRNDGVPAYNLAVVVDDAVQGVTEVVRGDDLLSTTPRQSLLQDLLGLPTPRYAHVPLVLGARRARLAKRHGAVTLADLARRGVDATAVLARLGASLGLCRADETVTADELIARASISTTLPRAAVAARTRRSLTRSEAMATVRRPAADPRLPGCHRRTRRTAASSGTNCTQCRSGRREFCATVIRAAEAVGAFEPQPDDPVPGHEVSLAVISPRLFEAVEIDLGVRIWPQLQTVWPYIDYHGLRDVFVIRYALGEQESLRIHHDVAQVSASVKLNDGYEGAVLDFPRQGVTNASLGGRRAAGVAVAGHPSAPDDAAAQRGEVRAHDLVRAADVSRGAPVSRLLVRAVVHRSLTGDRRTHR